MKDGDIIGKFYNKDVIVTSGTVEWSEIYKSREGCSKQSIKIKGKVDLISTCICINRDVKKGEIVSAYTVAGTNERLVLGKIIRGDPSGLKKYRPPTEARKKKRDIRDYKGVITSCNVKNRYGSERQWLRAITGQMFITRKYINRDIKPGDEVEFKWFWNQDCKDPTNKYCTLCSEIKVIKHAGR